MGFMGSGKTTVGRFLADGLGWRFVDLDEMIEAEEGRTIPTIFREDGEEGFREIEDTLAQRLLLEDRIVLSSGGGWPCREDRLESLPDGTFSVWLQVSAEAALERVGRQGARRPLLEVTDPSVQVAKLLADREPYYRRAACWIDTEVLVPMEAARRIAECMQEDFERPLPA